MPVKKKRVFVGLSGGVDSSVAALLLKKKGYAVTGIHIRGYNVDGCGEKDAEFARRAAEHIGIPFYVWDMEREYRKSVVDYMIRAYRKGVTPNPDVMCNKEIKFGLFLEKAISFGADFIATGHYAVIRDNKGISRMFKAKDMSKDQTYFLWTLGQKELSRALFPLGKFVKADVRKIARDAGLPNAKKKDSQGVCFLGKVSMRDFLGKYIKEDPGPIITANGEIIGKHKGLFFYTIGQRHLGIKGMGGKEALHVSGKNKKNNALIVAPEEDRSHFSGKARLCGVNIVSGEKISAEKNIFVRTRYREPLGKAKIVFKEKGKADILFDKPRKFIAPGQSAVFYSAAGEVIGGGVIV